MIQSFQCPACGNLNPLGEPACTRCGQFFKYNCPVCGNPIDNRYLRCGSCNTLFNWSKPIQQNTEINPINTQQPNTVNMQQPNTATRQQTNVMFPNAQQSRVEVKQVRERTRSTNEPLTSRPMFWLILMVVCAIIIVLLMIMAQVRT
jgi:hypothetical protein